MCRLQYEEGSAPALALQATKQRTEKRFANYAGSNLLCGTDGLPHLIADPGLALRFGHAGEVFVSRPAVNQAYMPPWPRAWRVVLPLTATTHSCVGVLCDPAVRLCDATTAVLDSANLLV